MSRVVLSLDDLVILMRLPAGDMRRRTWGIRKWEETGDCKESEQKERRMREESWKVSWVMEIRGSREREREGRKGRGGQNRNKHWQRQKLVYRNPVRCDITSDLSPSPNVIEELAKGQHQQRKIVSVQPCSSTDIIIVCTCCSATECRYIPDHILGNFSFRISIWRTAGLLITIMIAFSRLRRVSSFSHLAPIL